MNIFVGIIMLLVALYALHLFMTKPIRFLAFSQVVVKDLTDSKEENAGELFIKIMSKFIFFRMTLFLICFAVSEWWVITKLVGVSE